MKISIEQIETNGLRCPNTVISFKNKPTGPVINLLQMPNGTGKTTIIELLQGALTGDAINWSPTKIKSYARKTEGDLAVEGLFKLTISIERNDKHIQIVVFQIDFDFHHGKVDFFTTPNKGAGMEDGWSPPKDLRQYITKSCVEVFVFKGDKVNDIISPEKEDAEVTIKAFFGIDSIEGFVGIVKDNFRNRVSQTTVNDRNVKSEKALLKRWTDRYILLKEKYEEFSKDLVNFEKKEKDLKDNWGDVINKQKGANDKQIEIESNIEETKNQLSKHSSLVFEQLKNPFSISNNLISGLVIMKDSLDRMKLPGASRTFFDELIAEDNGCICGRELDNKSIQKIEENIDSYLSNNEINIINDIKRGITEANDDASIVDGLKGLFDELNILHESHEDALNAKSVFDQNAKRNADKDGSDIFDKLTEITEKMVRARAAKRNLSKNSSLSDDDLKRPEKCYSYIIAEKAQDKFIEKIGGMSDMLKDVQANQILQKVITTAKDKALIHLKDHLKKLTNQKLKETLSDGSQIEVLEIDKFVQLGWNNIKQSEGSGAQNIIVAYSFARSVLEEASIEFPLIVDHPVAQVDTANRESLGATLASMMHQFIGFLIDTERPGFLEGVNSGGDVHYISLFSDIKGNAAFIDSIKKINNDETHITNNGYLCYNKDFFIENSMGVGNV